MKEKRFFFEKCFKTLKPARWISPTCFEKKKKPFGRIVPPFFFESSESDRVFIYLHDSNSIFRTTRINSEEVFRLQGTSRTSTKREKISNSKKEKTSITMSTGRLDSGTTESHGETRWQRLHLHLRSGRFHSGKRVGTHGNLHHLRNGWWFRFPGKNSRRSTGGVDRIPTHKTWLKTKLDLLLLQESRGNPSLGSAETENTQNEDRSSKRIWWIRMFNHINTLPALLVNYQWSPEQKWYRARVSTVSLLTCRKIEIVTSPWKRKLQGLLAEDALVQSCPERKIWVI